MATEAQATPLRRPPGDDPRWAWGYGVWLTVGIVIAIPEIWAAVGRRNVPWPTISGTIGELEWLWSPTAIIVVAVIVFTAFHAIRYPVTKPHDARDGDQPLRRTAGGRVTRRPECVTQWSPYQYFPLAAAAVAGGSLIELAVDGGADEKWHLGYVLYGLIAVFWIALPSAAAYWLEKEVPFPTLFRSVLHVEDRRPFIGLVIATGLVVLLLHLAFYPWPSIAHVLQHRKPTPHSN